MFNYLDEIGQIIEVNGVLRRDGWSYLFRLMPNVISAVNLSGALVLG